jgi:hypothetical protein
MPTRPSSVAALGRLRRAWWFPSLPGLRGGGDETYERFDLDAQPRIVDADDQLSWLEDEPKKKAWSIERGGRGQQMRPLTVKDLRAIAPGWAVPASLLRLAEHQELQRRIRSATACFLDLGDQAARTTADGAVLMHLLSDQQWCRHWLLYLDQDGGEAVLTSTEPVGFELPEDWAEEYGDEEIPEVIPLDGSLGLEVCADSFAEFLYRFWLENELHFALTDHRPLTGRLARYAEQLRQGP